MTVETTPITPTTETGTDIEARQHDLDTAKASLAEFEKEAANIPAAIRAAAEQMDAPEVVRLRERLDAVPSYIAAGRLLVARRSIALMEARLLDDETVLAAAQEEEVRVTAIWAKAQAKLDEAIGTAGQRQVAVNSGRIALQEQRRALEGLLHESAQPPGLNVRSIWQAG